jgi:rod shape-determining protein MreC
VAFEEKVEPGEWFYTSGDDRIFPRGFPVGVVKAVHSAQPFKEVLVEPSGLQRGLEDVLILVEGVHQAIPETPSGNQPVYIAPPPTPGSAASPAPADTQPAAVGTEADRLRTQYKAIGDAQGHTFGVGLPGSKPPDFNLKLPPPTPAPTPGSPATPARPSASALPNANGAGAVGRGPGAGSREPAAVTAPVPAAPPPKPADAGRRMNQAAGAGPGGLPR